jgi:CubicO group peptidase (beta-lactamase class C family)
MASAGPDLASARALMDRFVAEGKVAGAVAAVYHDGHLVLSHATGFQDAERRIPMTEASLFRIYSMAKPVTSVAAMMLWEEGHFQLDDPVSRFLPEFDRVFVRDPATGVERPPSRPITVRDLMVHTSGLSHRTSPLYREQRVRSRAEPLDRFVERITAAPLMEDPGTRYRYSEGTTVLGRLVEIWSAMPLDRFMQERIFTPLGMVDTDFWVPPAKVGRLAAVHTYEAGKPLVVTEIEEVPFTERPALLEGAVGLVSTAADYLRFSRMLLDGGELDGVRLLRETTVEAMTRNGLDPVVQQARGGAMGWGLANVNVLLDAGRAGYPANVGEYGWDGSAGTIFWIDPDKRLVTILMTQSVPANPDRFRQQFKTLVEEAVAARR